MNEFERRLYDYLVEDGSACPPFFLQTVLGIGDFKALVEALNHLVAMGVVENGPQGYRACEEWQGGAEVDCAAGTAFACSSVQASRCDNLILQPESLSRQCEDDACEKAGGRLAAGEGPGLRSDVDCEVRPAVVTNECVQSAPRGCFDGMSEQEIERAFQDLFQGLGIREAQLDDPDQLDVIEVNTEGSASDDVLSAEQPVVLEEGCARESTIPRRARIAHFDDPLNEAGLPARVVGALSRLGILTVEQLCCLSRSTQFQDIGQLPKLGHKTEEDTYAWLDTHAHHIDDEAYDCLSQYERALRSETDYFINRLGLLCRFDCAGAKGHEQIDDGQGQDALLQKPLDELEIPGFTKGMMASLKRHGVRAVEDLLVMDTELVLQYRGWGSGKKRKLDSLVARLRSQLETGGCPELSPGPSGHPRLFFSFNSEHLSEDALLLTEGIEELGYPLYIPTAAPWLNECAAKGLNPHEAASRLIGQEPIPEVKECLASVLYRRLDEAIDGFRRGYAETCSILVPDAPGWGAAAYECLDEEEGLSYDEHARLLTKKTLTLEEWVSSIENDAKRTILAMRLAGSTLQEAADEVKLTRERARQIENALLESSPLLSVLAFRALVDSYEISESQFVEMGLGTPSEYRYLDKTGRRRGGRRPLAMALHDRTISEAIKSEIAAYINKERSKYYVQVEGGIVRIDKMEIVQHLLEKAAESGCPSLSIDDLLKRYRDFCSGHELENRKGIEPGSARAMLAFLQRKDTVLASSGQSIRLYDFNAYDFTDLELALDSMKKESIECSVRVITRRFPSLLDEYDLLDEYELHHVIRHLNFDKSIGFELGRSPMIKFGDADRDEQVKALIREKGSISVDDLAIVYEKKFGVSQDSFKACFLTRMGQYRHGSVYSMSEAPLTNRERCWLEAELEGVSYISLEFIRQRFIDEFSLAASQKICDHNLSSLGFAVSEDLIVSRSVDVEAAFSRLLDSLTFTFEGEEGLSAEVMTHSLFRSGLDSRLRRFQLIKFECEEDGRTVFVSENNLHELFSIDAEFMRSYVRHVIEYVGSESPFTMKSLRDSGFVDVLDLIRTDVRFGDSFFESVLSAGIGDLRIGTSTCRGVRIFSVTAAPFSSVSLFEYLVAREGAVDLEELQGILLDEFGIEAGLTYMRSVVARSHIVSRPGDMLFASDEAYAEFRDALIAAL